MYKDIFVTNILQLIQQRGLSKQDLARLSGVSVSFLSDLTRLKGNPSLKVMADVADGLEVPLDWLLSKHDLSDVPELPKKYKGRPQGVPEGFEVVTAVLPKVFAAQVRRWDAYYRSPTAQKKEKRMASKR